LDKDKKFLKIHGTYINTSFEKLSWRLGLGFQLFRLALVQQSLVAAELFGLYLNNQ